MKNNKPTALILGLLVIAAFFVGLKFDSIRETFSSFFERQNTPYQQTVNISNVSEEFIPEPEPEAPKYVFSEVSGEFYVINECFSRLLPEADSDPVGEFAFGDAAEIVAVETNSGWYKLSDDSYISPENVNEGSIIPMDTTMYVAKSCNVRSGPSTDFDKVGKYETEGEGVHVTGMDIFTGWYQIDGEKYVGESNLIDSRTEPLNEKMFVVKKCNVRNGPGTDFDKITEYNSGKEVHVVGRDIFTGWYVLEGDLYVGSSNLSKVIPTVYNSADNLRTIKYSWTTWNKRQSVTWSLKVDKGVYEYYKGLKRTYNYTNYDEYFKDASNDYYVKAIADGIKSMGEKQKLSKPQIAQEAVYFISVIPYVTDKKSRKADEWPKYVIETIYDDGGDCEDTSILTAAVLMQYGYKVALIHLPGHVAVGVAGSGFSGTYYNYEGEKYYYVETTGEGWKIGQIPDEFKSESASLYLLN